MRCLPLAFAACLLCACDRPAAPTAQPSAAATSPLRGRLDAALAIAGGEARDAALRAVARDAADAGDAEVVIAAIGGMTAAGIRNSTAEACAATFAGRSDPKSAGDLSRLITSDEALDRVLKAIAEGR